MRRLIRGTARLLNRARGYHPARIGGERFRTDPDHIGFWREVSRARWEPATFHFLERSLRPDSVFADVGAWIGPTTIFAARRSRLVYGFEPDPDAYRYLLWNLHLNALANVVPMNAALGAETGMRRLYGSGGRLGSSQSSLLPAQDQPSMPVFAIAWREWLEMAKPGRIDCIKMDIEGGEFELLPAMRAQLEAERPALHLSLHAGRLPELERRERLAEVLDLLRVYPSWRNEAGEPVTPETLTSVALAGDCALLLTDG